MDRIEAIMERARRARAVIEDATVIEAIDHIANETQKRWRSTTAGMAEARETLFHQIAALDAIKAQLKAWVEQAEFEQQKIDKQQNRRLRVVR